MLSAKMILSSEGKPGVKKMIAPLLAALLLCSCVPPQKISQEKADAAHYRAELKERDAGKKCDALADPGSPQHLACMLEAEKPPSGK
jgi:hypothetical protein